MATKAKSCTQEKNHEMSSESTFHCKEWETSSAATKTFGCMRFEFENEKPAQQGRSASSKGMLKAGGTTVGEASAAPEKGHFGAWRMVSSWEGHEEDAKMVWKVVD